MPRSLRIGPIVVVLVLSAALASVAQQPQSSSQWNQVREKYKYTFQLMQMVGHIDAIDQDSKYTLTQTQAKKVLGVLQPLRSKPKLTQDQAKQALKDLKPIFTVTQLNAMAKIKPPQRGQRPDGQGGPGAPNGTRPGGGQGRPSGSRPHMDAAAMQDFNPFYTKVDPKDEFAQRRVKRWNDFFTRMDNKSQGKKTTPATTTKPASSTTKKAPAKK